MANFMSDEDNVVSKSRNKIKESKPASSTTNSDNPDLVNRCD
jgi:hypothetical protein